MFSKELEALIEATLEDGVLEEHEKAALVKRAQREGVDLDELEIYIDSILQRRKKEQKKENEALDAEYEQKKKEAFGHTCPNCGKQVPPMTLKCDCGYEFIKNTDVSSVQKLFDSINNIQLTDAEIESCRGFTNDFVDENGNVRSKIRQRKINELITKKKMSIISTFPVPNTKEDIIEFLSMSAPLSKKVGSIWGSKIGKFFIIFGTGVLIDVIMRGIGIVSGIGLILGAIIALSSKRRPSEHNDLAKTWRGKFDQVMMKARAMRGDSEFQQQLDYYEKIVNSGFIEKLKSLFKK